MNDKNIPLRVRIAPSPTGYLHVGTARTALFNYLFAKSKEGAFLLRIEDTDLKRSREEMVSLIIDGLKWMKLDWDEEIVYQSDYFDDYRERAIELLKDGLAYWCYCTLEELEERRSKAINKEGGWIYDRRCYNISEEQKQEFEKDGRKKALRFLVPSGTTVFTDFIHGEIKRENSEIEDFVILKSDGTPTYNFAVVLDDYRMGITHILRGDDHITNTPKQILLYKAFGFEIPEFGHVPLILGKDHSKLSKRHGAVSISHYIDEGFLPEAFVNYLSFLGWSPKTDKEIFSLNELIDAFSIENIHKTPAIFDLERLEWLNREWMNRIGVKDLAFRLKKYLDNNGINIDDIEYLEKVVTAMGKRPRKLKHFIEYGDYFFSDDFKYDEDGIKKYFYPSLQNRLKILLEKLNELKLFKEQEIENIFREVSKELDCKAAELIHPVRIGVSGSTVGPGLFKMLEILGKERIIKRLEKLVKYLEEMK
jgi:glutamyl-tRNA synthetase